MKKSKINRIACICLTLSLLTILLSGVGCTPASTGDASSSSDTGSTVSPSSPSSSSSEKAALDYPTKPITIIVPMSPGGPSDVGYRLLQPYLAKELGVEVIIENKPGASSQVGLTEGLQRAADGYTVMHVHQTLTSTSILVQNAQYSLDDFAIVNTLHLDPDCVAVTKDSPYQNLSDVIKDIQARPGEVSMSVSRGSSSFILFNWLKDQMKLDFNIVPYDSANPARVACLGGHTNFVSTTVSDINTDKESFRAIAVNADEENLLYPGVQTVKEQLKAFDIDPDSVPSMPSWRALGFKSSFKTEYPERWQFFVDAYTRAYNNPEHLEAVKQAGFEGIMHICETPEDARQEFENIHKTFETFASYVVQ